MSGVCRLNLQKRREKASRDFSRSILKDSWLAAVTAGRGG